METTKKIYQNVFKQFAWISLIYIVARVTFLILNFKAFHSAKFIDILLAFLHGLRFDFSAILTLNAGIWLFSMLPAPIFQKNISQKILKYLLLVVNLPFIILNFSDCEFFKYVGRRTQRDILGIAGDVFEQSIQIAIFYWYLSIILLAILFIFIKYFPKNEAIIKESYTKKTYISLSLLLLPYIAISILGIRGGWQLRPLRPNYAFVLNPQILGHFSLNSTHTFISSYDIVGEVESKNFFKTDQEAFNIIKKEYVPSNYFNTKQNVVILILESFDAEYIGACNGNKNGYTPFFDSLANSPQSVFFKHGFANGRTSIEAMPSVLAGLPSMMPEAYITGFYQTNQLTGLGTEMLNKGYKTAFYHGGKNGTMGFNAFAPIAGFQQYSGLFEYPNQKDYDGNWGIFDEPYLQYFSKQLTTYKQPFLASVFTLSSHQPYTIPEKYTNKFPKGDLEIHESIGYADNALKLFFETASKQPWFNNTLFVLTADHTQMTSKPAYFNKKGEFSVPIVFYHPKVKLKADTSIIAQQIDIMPSVLSVLGYKPSQGCLPFGKNLFQNNNIPEALCFDNNELRLFTANNIYIALGDADNKVLIKNSLNDQEIKNDSILKIFEPRIKAYRQYYNNSLIKNKW